MYPVAVELVTGALLVSAGVATLETSDPALDGFLRSLSAVVNLLVAGYVLSLVSLGLVCSFVRVLRIGERCR